MDIRTALKLGIAQLRAASVPSHTLAAELLVLHATGRTRTWLYSHPEDHLTESESQNYFMLIERRAAGVPTQQLTGKQEFWGLEFEVTRDVLIPRPETEPLIEVALDRLALRDLRAKRLQNMSGESAKFYALDISSAALEVAKRNATRLGFSDRITFLESDLLAAISPTGAKHSAPLRRKESATPQIQKSSRSAHQSPVTSHQSPRFDLIVSNPPYIAHREAATLAVEVRNHEPAVALFGGEEGYELYANLITQSALHLRPGGLLVLELGHDSLPAVQPLFEPPAWANVGVTNDLAGIPRVLSAERTSQS